MHMDLFGPTFVRSINHKIYYLVVTDDYSWFSWVFFLATKDETSRILKTFITGIENQINHKVKIIRCDNGTEFKNNDMNQFYGMKGIKREFSVARIPQQNGVAERKNMTLIEAARTMLADLLLPITFWAEAVNTACYVQNRVLVTKPHNKTPYELLLGLDSGGSSKRQEGYGTKWVYRNKKDERGIVVRNKARLVAQGYTQEEGIENGYRRGTIYKTLFIKKDRGDILLVQVYVDDIIFGSTKKSLCVEFEQMMHKRFQMSSMGELTFFLGLQLQQKEDGIFISQDKYVADVLKKFDFTTVKAIINILKASRPDIMFVVCACARFQVTPKTLHLHAVKRIFRYLKGQPKLGLWYPRDSPFDLEAFSDSDYARASLDRKSTTGGCQFLGKRLISWQCKKQTIVANSTTEAEYIVVANCYGHNPVFHSKTKHIEIRHHFIKDSYEKKLIQVIKIHTDHNVADLLIKAFDVSRKVKRTTKISQSSGPIHLVADETVYKEWEDIIERAAITASGLEAEQDSGNINRTQSMATLNESLP
ncbi:putative ribonuclease H-like domain-containing protein [Tanacetum coccineum]